LVRVDEPDIIVDIPKEVGSPGIISCCSTILDQLEQHRSFLYPIEVYVLGKGIVLDDMGQECEQPDVTFLWGKTLDAHIVDVCTQSDAWLPYDFLAKPQFKVYEQNAPRLENALQEIQEYFGITPYSDTCSDYAVIERYRLNNLVDIDNEVLQVYREL
jgi:hypothetical protein